MEKFLGKICFPVIDLSHVPRRTTSMLHSIELMASMIDVINLESSVTPLPCSERKGKKKKTQTVTQPKPKS
ncbi:hypothetical protein Tco_1000403 [Tanacetum coccineum]